MADNDEEKEPSEGEEIVILVFTILYIMVGLVVCCSITTCIIKCIDNMCCNQTRELPNTIQNTNRPTIHSTPTRETIPTMETTVTIETTSTIETKPTRDTTSTIEYNIPPPYIINIQPYYSENKK
jgi:hypothetical protein